MRPGTYEFKAVLRKPDGSYLWEDGKDRVLEVRERSLGWGWRGKPDGGVVFAGYVGRPRSECAPSHVHDEMADAGTYHPDVMLLAGSLWRLGQERGADQHQVPRCLRPRRDRPLSPGCSGP